MVLRVLAPVACAYSLTAEVSLVGTNRQGANAVRHGHAEQQTVARGSLIRASSDELTKTFTAAETSLVATAGEHFLEQLRLWSILRPLESKLTRQRSLVSLCSWRCWRWNLGTCSLVCWHRR
jgi:hypothetical protein